MQDPLGRKIGTLERLFVGRRGEPRYIEVNVGFLLSRRVLLPVEVLTIDADGRSVTLSRRHGDPEELCVQRREQAGREALGMRLGRSGLAAARRADLGRTSEVAAEALGSAPTGYRLKTCDPEVLLLLRADGTRVAAFSARAPRPRLRGPIGGGPKRRES